MVMHKRITEQLRRQILSGERKAGETLPTIQELAAAFGTSVYTIHTAITPLVVEGLVDRRRRFGTVVRHNAAVLTRAAIYGGSGLLDEWEYAFYRELCRQFQRQLGEAGVGSTLFADMRPRANRGVPLPELARAVATREVQALFVVLTDNVSSAWLRELPVTASYVGADESLSPVGFDGEQMLRLALGRLRDQGCRDVGLISAIAVPADVHHPYFRFYDAFVATIGDLGLRTRDEWVVTPPEHVADHERYGYDAVKRLRQAPVPPEGLLIYPDTSARGAVLALCELGVRVPGDLKLVCHRNTGVEWTCPLPVSWVESDTAQCAAAMIRQVRQQKDGQPIQPVRLPYRLY